MAIRVKKSKPQSGYSSGNAELSLLNNSGQAIIEYVLMLIISVSLILTLVTQIFKPMEKYMQAFMGDYVQCLLETGALPSFGGDSVPNAQDMGCVMPNFQDVAGKRVMVKGPKGAEVLALNLRMVTVLEALRVLHLQALVTPVVDLEVVVMQDLHQEEAALL